MDDAAAGLCARCRFARFNHTRRGTVYLRCARARVDPRFSRYPELPVLTCVGYESAPDQQAPDQQAPDQQDTERHR